METNSPSPWWGWVLLPWPKLAPPTDTAAVQFCLIRFFSPLINVQESRSVALGFPASTLSLSRLSGSPSIPLISLPTSSCRWLCEVPWIYTSL